MNVKYTRFSALSILCALLVTMLSGCYFLPTEEPLLEPPLQEAEEVTYDTYTVTTGNIEFWLDVQGNFHAPESTSLSFGETSGLLDKIYVKLGDEVKAGDLLATFTRDVDEVALERNRISLLRGEEAYQRQMNAYQDALDELMTHLAMETDSIERKMLSLRIDRKKIECDKYAMETQHALTVLRESIAEMEADYAVTELYAPVDGKIEIVAYKQPDEKISTSEVLLTITEQRGLLFLVDNSNQHFRYGMDVTMEIGGNGNRITVDGKIVACDMLIPESRRQNAAYMLVDEAKLSSVKLTRPIAYAQVYYLDNVLVVPKKAVTLAEGKYYVTLLQNGMPAKRYVNFAMNALNTSLLLDGVSAGDLIIID